MDSETTAPPMRPIYPRADTSTVLWVRAAGSEPPVDLPQVEAPPIDLRQADPNHDLEFTADGRPYREWQGETSYADLCSRVGVLTRRPLLDESGAPANMVGALIPQGYELDETIPGRRWICPVRSCRIACKARWSLGYHFMVSLSWPKRRVPCPS